MRDIYELCPIYENARYRFRLVGISNCKDLLEVYSDTKAVPFFNSDNCNGDNFYYTTVSRMKQAIIFWLVSYSNKNFVRFVIMDKISNEAIGTIELFNRKAEDYFTNCGLLRLDLRSDYEQTKEIESILNLILTFVYNDFQCDKVATKAVPQAVNRISALKNSGFQEAEDKLIGHDGTQYDSYFVIHGEKDY